MVLGHIFVDSGGQYAEISVEENNGKASDDGNGGDLDYCPDLLFADVLISLLYAALRHCCMPGNVRFCAS